MFDPRKLPATNKPENLGHGQGSTGDAPRIAAFAPEPKEPISETIIVRGAVWAEYHLLLAAAPHAGRFDRIEREVRMVGGAPLVARLLARKLREGASDSVVHLSLELGEDPNARLVRREVEKLREPNLQARLQVLASAPEVEVLEVPYRIVMWPDCASTYEQAQVLQCGDVGELEVSLGGSKYLRPPLEVPGLEAGFAAWAHSRLSGAIEGEAIAREDKARAAWRALRFLNVVEASSSTWGAIPDRAEAS